MTNTFAYNCEKLFDKYGDDEEIVLIRQDIGNAKQGVMTFLEEDKKRALQSIHDRYDGNEEVRARVENLKGQSKCASYDDIALLQDECYFWYDFLHSYSAWKIIGKQCGFKDSDEAMSVLVRLQQFDDSVFSEFSVF